MDLPSNTHFSAFGLMIKCIRENDRVGSFNQNSGLQSARASGKAHETDQIGGLPHIHHSRRLCDQKYVLFQQPSSLDRPDFTNDSEAGIYQTRLAGSLHETSPPLSVRFKSFRHPFIVVPWFEGRWPSPKSLNEMYRCGRTLAKFHQASKGLAAKSHPPAVKAARWPAMLKREHQWLVNAINTSQNHPVRRYLQPLLAQHGPEILHYADEAKALLKQSNYAALRNSSRHLLHICHGDGGPSNFIFRPNGVYLIDFETMRLDFRAYDLYRIIYNSCKGHHWKFSIARALLDGYQSVSRLTPDDFAFIKIWLRFPKTAWLFFI
jgi:CotS family spore coat protein